MSSTTNLDATDTSVSHTVSSVRRPRHPHVGEELYDLKIRDVGFLPEAEQHRRAAGTTMYEMGHDAKKYPLEKILALESVSSHAERDLSDSTTVIHRATSGPAPSVMPGVPLVRCEYVRAVDLEADRVGRRPNHGSHDPVSKNMRRKPHIVRVLTNPSHWR